MLETQIIALIVSFFTTFVTVPWLIKKLKRRGITGIDHNKFDKPSIPEMGGLAVVIGFIAGASTILVINRILDGTMEENTFPILAAALMAVLGAALAGIMDDLFTLRQRLKAVIPFLFAIPVGVVMEKTTMYLVFDTVEFGVLMMVIAPFGVTCAANAGNMLEGFNGLGAGLGIIISISLIFISFWTGDREPMLLLFPLLGALIAFLWFNRYPGRIFPGDTLTLFMGATIACAAIMGNMKTVAALLFIPMIIEFFLKLRGRFTGENYGTPDKEGYLSYDGRVESLTHLIMNKKKVNEKQLVLMLYLIEGALCFIITALIVIFVPFNPAW